MINYSTLTRFVSAVLLAGALACVSGHAQQAGQRVVNQYPVEP